MLSPKRVLKTALKPWIRRRAHGQLGLLRSIGVSPANKIADAIDEVLANDLSPEEQDWAHRIESLRTSLSRSTTPLSLANANAGSSVESGTAEQMSSDVAVSTVAETCRASKPYFWCLLLFKLVRKLQPEIAIELGTCLGISAAYQAAAAQLNGLGKLITLEGAVPRAELSARHLKSLGLDNAKVVTGRFEHTLQAVLENNTPIDYGFIDGHHDEHATIEYYEQFLPYLVDESVLVFDDIAWSPGMRRAWQSLQNHQNIALSLDLRNVGICVVTKRDSRTKHRVKMWMPA